MRHKLDVLNDLYRQVETGIFEMETLQIPIGDGKFKEHTQPRLDKEFLETTISQKRRRLDDVRRVALGEPLASVVAVPVTRIVPEPEIVAAAAAPSPSTSAPVSAGPSSAVDTPTTTTSAALVNGSI